MPQPSFYAALILPDTNGMAPGPYLSAATDAVARADCAPGCRPGMSDDLTAVWGDTIRIEITPQEDSDYGPRILFTARATSNARFSEDRAATILSHTLVAALRFSPADIIEWNAPDILLDTEDFLTLRSYVSPNRRPAAPVEDTRSYDEIFAPEKAARRAPTSQDAHADAGHADPLAAAEHDEAPAHATPQATRLPPPSQIADRLMIHLDALREIDPPELRMRAASWAMTGTVAMMSPPVGASMGIIGLVRGMDFRRVTQAMTITGLFVVLHQAGAFSLLLP
mgnify:CR=1 FL=1